MAKRKHRARPPDSPLRLFRRVNHLSQIEAARLVQCQQSTWNRLERGEVLNPRKALIERVMALTNLPIESILVRYVKYLPVKRVNVLGTQPRLRRVAGL